MRNRIVTFELRKKYQGLTPEARNLRTACVSNLRYDCHLLGYDKDYIPISLEATGIPGLRLELSAIPAQGKLSVVQRHWSASLIGTMTSMNNYSSQSASHRQGGTQEGGS